MSKYVRDARRLSNCSTYFCPLTAFGSEELQRTCESNFVHGFSPDGCQSFNVTSQEVSNRRLTMIQSQMS